MKRIVILFVLIILCGIPSYAQGFEFSWDGGGFNFASYLEYQPAGLENTGSSIYMTSEFTAFDLTFFWRDLGLGFTVGIAQLYTDTFLCSNEPPIFLIGILPIKIFWALPFNPFALRVYASGGIHRSEDFATLSYDATVGIDFCSLPSPNEIGYATINSVYIGYDILTQAFIAGFEIDVGLLGFLFFPEIFW